MGRIVADASPPPQAPCVTPSSAPACTPHPIETELSRGRLRLADKLRRKVKGTPDAKRLLAALPR